MDKFREAVNAVRTNEAATIKALAGALLAGDVEAAVQLLSVDEALALMAASDEAAGQSVGAISPNPAALASAREKLATALDASLN